MSTNVCGFKGGGEVGRIVVGGAAQPIGSVCQVVTVPTDAVRVARGRLVPVLRRGGRCAGRGEAGDDGG